MQINRVEIYTEIGAGTHGASLGIDALKVAAVNAGHPFFKTPAAFRLDFREHPFTDGRETPHARYCLSIEKEYNLIIGKLAHVAGREGLTLVLSSNHASAGATIAGIKRAHPAKRLGVIWIDAHADVHSPYTSPSGNMHGMALALSLAEDNLENQCNQPDEETIKCWNRMKETGGMSPKIEMEDLVYIGLSSFEEEEERLLKKNHVPVFGMEELRGKGIESVVYETLSHLKACDMIYVSFDVDVLDSKLISSGTGTPVDGGLTEDEAKKLLRLLLDSGKVKCLETVEVNPTLDDKGNAMAEAAFRLLSEVLG